MAQKTGALIFDETADRYDIRFDIADYYGGLHCFGWLCILSAKDKKIYILKIFQQKQKNNQVKFAAMDCFLRGGYCIIYTISTARKGRRPVSTTNIRRKHHERKIQQARLLSR